MRLFHTSDWHLGQNLHGQERDFEHACFLEWLLRQLQLAQPDVLLIAGDIFDTVNPPVKAQERLYDFIVSAHEQQPLLTIVMIAGNHDSGSRIELPAPLAEILVQLADLPNVDLLAETQRQPWLEVRVRLDEPQPDLRHQVETALQGKAVRLVRIAAEYAGNRGADGVEDGTALIELDQLTPQELFSRAWLDNYGSEVDEQTLKDFAELLQDVQMEGEQP